MKHYIARFGFIVMFLLSIFSVQSKAADVWAYDQEITEVRYISDSGFNLYVESLPSGCDGAFRVRIGQEGINDAERKELMSLALTGLSLKSNVNVRYDDATSNCYVVYMGVKN